ncbi:hypothetical protein [Pseudovibrio sp. Ad26]|uniref:hypothetical protein n=1 Tax=Pseudovibrio sp. Ad26 TaxID=989410 RepID=UPI0007AE943B|nr:hypothetical protein [Pseudovibrio sp. Ad26]KZK97203.1 hypothetical protein PsAD26_05608 [Pseudovibrio sp. Ad26]
MDYLIARFVHILLIAAWFGMTISGKQRAQWFARENLAKAAPPEIYLRKASVAGSLIGLGVIASGFWLIHLLGGFDAVPWSISLGFAASLAIVLTGALMIGRNWKKLATRRAAGAPQAELEAIAKQVGLWERAVQLLWLVALVSMVFRFEL